MTDKLYRIESRDLKAGPKLDLEIGTHVQFDRIVCRVGYRAAVNSKDIPEEWNNKGLEILSRELHMPVVEVAKVVSAMKLFNPWKGLKHKIYKELLNEMQLENMHAGYKDYNQRCMWFHDFQAKGRICDRKRFWVGTYYPASGGISSDLYGEYDNYEPAGLYPAYNQNLYVIKLDLSYVNKVSCNDFLTSSVLVHPDDVEVI